MRIRPAALIIENNHVLLLAYHYEAGTKFALPGGNVDSSENFDQTVRRELEEELGIEVEVGEMIAVGQVHATTDYEACLHIMERFFTAYNPKILPNNQLKLSGEWTV